MMDTFLKEMDVEGSEYQCFCFATTNIYKHPIVAACMNSSSLEVMNLCLDQMRRMRVVSRHADRSTSGLDADKENVESYVEKGGRRIDLETLPK